MVAFDLDQIDEPPDFTVNQLDLEPHGGNAGHSNSEVKGSHEHPRSSQAEVQQHRTSASASETWDELSIPETLGKSHPSHHPQVTAIDRLATVKLPLEVVAPITPATPTDWHAKVAKSWNESDWVTLCCGSVAALILTVVCIYKHVTDIPGNFQSLLGMLVIAFWYLLAVHTFHGKEAAEAWLTGYLLESALSLDDIFTIHLIFVSFAVPDEIANYALAVAIFVALILRSMMIICLSSLLEVSYAVNIFVGCLLIAGAIFTEVSDPDEDVKELCAVRFFKAMLGDRLQETHEGMPIQWSKDGFQCNVLFLVLCLVVTLDGFSAVDVAGSKTEEIGDTYINISSSVMVVLTLRPLFFIIRHMARHFDVAKHGIAAILIFLGIEMIVMKWFPVSLLWLAIVIVSIIVLCVLVTVLRGGSSGDAAQTRRAGRKDCIASDLCGDLCGGTGKPKMEPSHYKRQTETTRTEDAH